MRARIMSDTLWITRVPSRSSGNSAASRTAIPSRRSASHSSITPPSEDRRPPSKAAVTFFPRMAGNEKEKLSFGMAGVAERVSGQGVVLTPNPTLYQTLKLHSPACLLGLSVVRGRQPDRSREEVGRLTPRPRSPRRGRAGAPGCARRGWRGAGRSRRGRARQGGRARRGMGDRLHPEDQGTIARLRRCRDRHERGGQATQADDDDSTAARFTIEELERLEPILMQAEVRRLSRGT